MIHIETIIGKINILLGSSPFLFAVILLATSIKLTVLFNLLLKKNYSSRLTYYLLVFVLVSTLIQDMDWLLMLTQKLFLSGYESRIFVFWRRLSWASTVLQYQSLTLFLESLITNNFKLRIRHKLFIFISSLLALFFIGISILDFDCLRTIDKPIIEIIIQKISSFYTYFPLILISIIISIRKLRNGNIPRLIKKQASILLSALILPFWFFDGLQISSFLFSFNFEWLNTSYIYASFSNIFITIAIIYCSRRMLGLRFLNFNPQVQTPVDINFMENFKVILEQFSHVTNLQELNHITQHFFKEAFSIPLNRTYLYIRNLGLETKTYLDDRNTIYSTVETFMATHPTNICDYLKRSKIVVYDELAFSNFYESTVEQQAFIDFMEAIQADVFLPVYEKESLVGYIVVDRHARLNAFYSSTEYDEMLIFSSYLGNIINLMQHKNLDTLIQQEKNLQEELYHKHQEINQYKESIRSFLRSNKKKDIGIIFYKNRRFIFGNQEAKELVGVNPNIQEGHPLSRALKKIAQQVEAYKTPQITFAKDEANKKVVLSAVPSLEKNNVIITIYYPEISDVIKKQVDILKDPSEWDYLLYLETTKPGKLINQLIPGSGETLLNFKIDLLKTALTKKATLLSIPDEDLHPMVDLLHHISLRETLHTIELSKPEENFDIAIKLFGINRLLGMGKDTAPLLEKLDTVGTLFIKNIHFLNLETQDYLAEFIRYGLFKVFKSDQKIPSNVRIICSSDQDLKTLVEKNIFSKKLFNELKTTNLHMPSLETLSENELDELADGFSEQVIANKTFKNLLTLTDKEKDKIASNRPTSLQELKQCVQEILSKKSENKTLDQTHIDTIVFDTDEPELLQATHLGKQALKDKKIMTALWVKFKNQNKIASFLGVNRSSVNRRCKMYGLTE